jgi:putative hydrolase of the HAD superfamily
MIRTLVFDLDDTLYPEHQFVLSGFAAVDEWLRNERNLLGFAEAASAVFASGVRGDIFNRALDALGLGNEVSLVPRLVEVYRDHTPRIQLFPDAQWALDYFAPRMRFGLITDGYLQVQQRKVAALGIAERFESIVFSDVFGREGWKPSPLPYERIMTDLGCKPSDCVYVGDNPKKDFVTARRLGWMTIRIRRPGCEHSGVKLDGMHEAESEIGDLQELKRLLGENGA